MKFLKILVCLVFFYSCRTNKSENQIVLKSFLQTKVVQLANPKIEVDQVIIDSSSLLTATLELDDTEIFYTIDGEEPTQSSKKYKQAVFVSEKGKYMFKAFHEDFMPSDVETVTFFKRGIHIDNFFLKSSLYEKYSGQGKNTLINHQKGSLNFRDGQWIGVTEPFIAEIDFKKKIALESLDIGFLINTDAWIFPIQDILIDFSKDGEHFESLPINILNNQLNKGVTRLDNIHIPVLKELRKIRIEILNTSSIPEWHQGKGNPAWLFMDEWIFNTKND